MRALGKNGVLVLSSVTMAQAEARFPRWLSRLLTDPVRGLDNYRDLLARLTGRREGSIKVYCEVAVE